MKQMLKNNALLNVNALEYSVQYYTMNSFPCILFLQWYVPGLYNGGTGSQAIISKPVSVFTYFHPVTRPPQAPLAKVDIVNIIFCLRLPLSTIK